MNLVINKALFYLYVVIFQIQWVPEKGAPEYTEKLVNYRAFLKGLLNMKISHLCSSYFCPIFHLLITRPVVDVVFSFNMVHLFLRPLARLL